MDNLYFTLATLPTLDKAGPPPFATLEAFWDYVDHLPSEWKAPWNGGPVTDPTVSAYRDFDRALRIALAHLRLEGVPWEDREAPLPPGGELWRAQALEALGLPSPLATENALDDLRWDFLEDLAQGHQFDRPALFVYVLKLELVQRRSALVKEKGLEIFDALHSQFLAEANLTISTGEQS